MRAPPSSSSSTTRNCCVPAEPILTKSPTCIRARILEHMSEAWEPVWVLGRTVVDPGQLYAVRGGWARPAPQACRNGHLLRGARCWSDRCRVDRTDITGHGGAGPAGTRSSGRQSATTAVPRTDSAGNLGHMDRPRHKSDADHSHGIRVDLTCLYASAWMVTAISARPFCRYLRARFAGICAGMGVLSCLDGPKWRSGFLRSAHPATTRPRGPSPKAETPCPTAPLRPPPRPFRRRHHDGLIASGTGRSTCARSSSSWCRW